MGNVPRQRLPPSRRGGRFRSPGRGAKMGLVWALEIGGRAPGLAGLQLLLQQTHGEALEVRPRRAPGRFPASRRSRRASAKPSSPIRRRRSCPRTPRTSPAALILRRGARLAGRVPPKTNQVEHWRGTTRQTLSGTQRFPPARARGKNGPGEISIWRCLCCAR